MKHFQTIGRPISLKLLVAGMQICWLFPIITLFNDQLAGRSWPSEALTSAYPVAAAVYLTLMFLVRFYYLGELLGVIFIFFYLIVAFKLWTGTDEIISMMPPPLEFFRKPLQTIKIFMPYLLFTGGAAVQWGLARRLVRGKIDITLLLVEFQLGVGCFLIALLLEYYFGAQALLIRFAMILFFVFSLTGIALARMNEKSSHQHHPLFPDGVFYLGLSGAAIGALTLLILMVNDPRVLEIMVDIVNHIKQWILDVVDLLMGLLPDPEWQTLRLDEKPQVGCGTAPGSRVPKYTNAHEMGRAIYSLLWIGIFLFVLWRISNSVFDLLKTRLSDSSAMTRQDLTGAFKADIYALISRLVATLIRLTGVIAALLSRLFPRYFSPWKRHSIRQIYADSLRWCAKAGFERAHHQTPYEHAVWVSRHRPQVAKVFFYMTHLFENDYYGEIVPSMGEFAFLLEEWQRLKRLKLKKKNQRKKRIWLFNRMWTFRGLKKVRKPLLQMSPKS